MTSAPLGRFALKIVESNLTDGWQSIDEIAIKCCGGDCGFSRAKVSQALLVLYREGVADRRYDPHYAHRTYQYRLASEVSE